MKRPNTIRALAAALALSVSNLTVAGATDVTDDINPEDFTVRIDNPFFPLPPGTTFIYRGNREGRKQRDEFTVTDRTVVIDGVTCRVVHDKVFMRGVLRENTFDYFAQDRDGNVWYFGEDTEELDKNGRVVSTAGNLEGGRRWSAARGNHGSASKRQRSLLSGSSGTPRSRRGNRLESARNGRGSAWQIHKLSCYKGIHPVRAWEY
jgi:hypothetical protein